MPLPPAVLKQESEAAWRQRLWRSCGQGWWPPLAVTLVSLDARRQEGRPPSTPIKVEIEASHAGFGEQRPNIIDQRRNVPPVRHTLPFDLSPANIYFGP
jgi:hypothetical protein